MSTPAVDGIDARCYVLTLPHLPQRMLQPGDVFIDDFEIEAVLGTGGFGTVYAAHQRSADRRVAIKVLHLDGIIARQRFELEAKIVSTLAHPSVVEIYDYGVDDGRHYMVLQFVEGDTLRETIDRVRTFGPRRSVRVLRDVAEAVSAAHEIGVFHRDLKPDNVILSDDDRVTVLDFGIAKLFRGTIVLTDAGPRTEAGKTVGTPRYMAPEVLCGENASASSDVFSLGMLLFEMLVGDRALPHLSELALVRRMVDFEPIDLPDDADVPDELRELLGQMLHKRPEERLSSTAELLQRLDALPDYPAQTEVVSPGALARLRSESAGSEPVDDAPTQIDGEVLPVSEGPVRDSPAEKPAAAVGNGDGSVDTDQEIDIALRNLRADAEARLRGATPEPLTPEPEPATEARDSHQPAPPRARRQLPDPSELDEPLELDRLPERRARRDYDWGRFARYGVLALGLFIAISYLTGLIKVKTTIENGHPLECGFGETSLHITRHIDVFGFRLAQLDREIRCTGSAQQ